MRTGAGHTLTPEARPQTWRVWSAIGAVYVIWGGTYLAIRLMIETVPPLLGAGLRFVLAGGLMLGVLTVRRGGWTAVRTSPRRLAHCALVGTLLAAGGNGLVTIAERDVPTGLAALLIASVPLWIALFRTIGRDRVAVATLAGVALGFVGVGVLLLPGGRPEEAPLGMTLLVVLAAVSWGLGSFTSLRIALPGDPLVATAWQLLFGGLVLTIAGVAAGEGLDPGAFSAKSVAAFAYLVLIGSIVAFSCYAYALAHAPISQVSTYAYVNPMIAVVLGAVFLNEKVGLVTVAGMALILASVVIVIRRESREPDPPPVDPLHEATDAARVSVVSRN